MVGVVKRTLASNVAKVVALVAEETELATKADHMLAT